MKILILGAGAIGGYFGGRLHQAGADVTFLVREARAQHIATHGLMLESPTDKATLQVKTVLAGQVKQEPAQGDYDVVILACKAYDLASSIAAITPAMGANDKSTPCVLPLLNGISHIATLDAAFGPERVMGGACQIAATLTPEGVVKALMPFQNIVWGRAPPGAGRAGAGAGPELCQHRRGLARVWRDHARHVGEGGLPLHAGRHDLPDAWIGWRHIGRARRRMAL